MSDAVAAPAAAPAPSAPAASPAPSAPTSDTSGGSGIAGSLAGVQGAAEPPSGAQEPPAPKPPRFPYKTRVKVGEEEIEHELDLAEYRHRVKVDGEELEVPFEDLGKSYERVRASMKRFDEASKLTKQAEAREAALGQQVQRIEAALKDPQQAARILRKSLGDQGYFEMLSSELRAQIDYEQMPPEQRQQLDQRTQAEQKLSQRERALAAREAEIKRSEEQRIESLAVARREQLVAEWTPALEAAGLPAKIAGKDGKMQVNGRIMAMLADTLRRAKASNAPLSLQEAVGLVHEEYEALVGHEVARRTQQTREAVAQQPGRGEPQQPQTPPAAPRQRGGEAQTAEEYMRNLRASWGR